MTNSPSEDLPSSQFGSFRESLPTPKLRILVVDDDAGSRFALENVLEAPNREVLTASSGQAAIRLAQDLDFALILLDIRMPGLDGYETCSRLRQLERSRKTPVIFMTASDPTPVEQAAGYSLGAVDYVFKPLDPEVLKKKVDALADLYLESQRHRREAEEAILASRALSAAVVEGTSDIVFVKDLEGRYLVANGAWAILQGQKPGEIIGKDDFALFPRDVAEALRSNDDRVAGSGAPLVFEERVPGPDGLRWFQTTKSPLRDNQGRVRGVIGIARDVTAQKIQEEANRFLAEAGSLLAASLDFEVTLETVARLAVPRIADWCSVDILDETGRVTRVATVHQDPAKIERGRRYLEARPVTLQDPQGSGAVLRTGLPQLVPWIPDLFPQSDQWHPEDRRLIEELGLRSVLIVPMKARGRTLGALTFLTAESGRRYGPADLDLAQEVARRAALAVDNAQLYREARREAEERSRAEAALRESRAELERELADVRTLQAVGAEMIREGDARALFEAIMEAATRIMRSQFASVQMLTDRGSGTELRLLGFRGFTPEAARFWEYVRPGSGSTCGMALGTGRRVIASDVERCNFMSGTEDLATYRQTGIRAVQTTPLFSRGGTLVGMISTHWREPHEPSERDLRLFDLLARQAADLIERWSAEEALRNLNAGLERRVEERTRELRAALGDLGAFAHTVSHDLQAPLRGIIGNLDVLLEEHGRHLTAEARECVERSVRATEQLERLIRDVLEYSQVTRPEFQTSSQDLDGVVGLALEELAPEVAVSGAQVHVVKPLGRVLGHSVMLGQAVKNLLSNALKFVPPGVRPVVRVFATKLEGRVRLSVEDNGIGICEADRGKLFRVFERLVPQSAYSGTGLGLAIVARAVERMGGSVGMESNPGGGSRFWIDLAGSKSA